MKKSEQEFLKLLEDCKKLEEQLKSKAWEITPDDIKECLCGERGLLSKNAKKVLGWLIRPHWRLYDKSPAELLAEGKIEEVKKFLDSIDSNASFS